MTHYYTYVHIRPDTGVIFNVGKGKGRRAWSKSDRNKHWHNVVNKNGGKFEVRILNWFNDEAVAYDAEIWQIAALAPLGNLVNKTPGGDKPPIVRMFKDANPMTRPEVSLKQKLAMVPLRKDPVYRKKCSERRKGKGTGDRNGMRQPEQQGIFAGPNNAMSKYEHREKHYSENKTRGPSNGMYGRTGDKNPAFNKPSAMRGKKNLGIAWVAECKTWQHYWGA
jgi:hypothetical protein